MATQTTTQSTTLPAALDQYGRYLLGEATNIYQNTPYEAYPYARVAGLTPDQQSGMGLARSNVGNWQPYTNAAAGAAGGVGGLAAALAAMAGSGSYQTVQSPVVASQVVGAQQFGGIGDVAKFMSPYESLVTQQGIRALEDTAARQQALSDARYAKAGAFGGSRQGLYDATLGSNTARAAGELANTSRAQNYTQGLAAWQADANRMLQADALTAQLAAQVGLGNAQNILKALQGNQTADLDSQRMGISALQAAMQGQLGAGQLYGNLANSTGVNGRADVNSLLGIGDLQRGVDQKNLDVAYGDWQDQQNYPWNQLNRLQSLGANNPLNRATTTTQTSPGPNTTAQWLGAGLGGLGLLTNTGAFGQNGWLTGSSSVPGGNYGIVSNGTDQFGDSGGFSDVLDSGLGSGLGDYGSFDWMYDGMPLI